MSVRLKSAYAPYDSEDGIRYLVETLWPEGVETHALFPFIWAHELAPSYDKKEMALWKKWTRKERVNDYQKELQEPERRGWFDKVVHEAKSGTVTLLHRSRKPGWQVGPEDTTAYSLKEFLEDELAKSGEISAPLKPPPAIEGVKAGIEEQDKGQWSNEGGR